MFIKITRKISNSKLKVGQVLNLMGSETNYSVDGYRKMFFLAKEPNGRSHKIPCSNAVIVTLK